METTNDHKLKEVFVFGDEPLEWAIDHFDNTNTKIILADSLGWLSEGTINEYMSRCTGRNFIVEKQTIEAKTFKQMILKLTSQHVMMKFVTFADEWTERKISELFDENPSFSCKIWFVSNDKKLVSIRNDEYRKNKEDILPRGKEEEKVLYQQEIEQLKQNVHLLTTETEQLKLENGELKNNLDENFKKLQEEKEHNQNLRVTVEILTEDRDTIREERDFALREAEELRKEKENIPNRINHAFNAGFTLQELEQATQDFNDSLKLGEGGFGCVYKGTLRGMPVAIKKLNHDSMQGMAQFQQEVSILSQIRHPHLVTLIGSCPEASAIVYEFLLNGSLEDRLARKNNTPPLTWQVRTRIIGEICLALIFLHSSKPYLVIHGDLNPNNILLDAKFGSKLSDFGISRLVKQPDTDHTAVYHTNQPAGTFAYIDPEYSVTGELTPKSDIYSLGIIILRLVTGTSPLDISRKVSQALISDRFHSMIDESAGNWPFDQAKILAETGLSCAQSIRSSRPNLVTGVWSIIEPLVKAASLDADENHIPHHFICPIFQEVMKDPHIAADGFTYEAEAINLWLNSGHNTSPMTNLVLPHHNLIPNHVLRSAIQEWLQLHPQP